MPVRATSLIYLCSRLACPCHARTRALVFVCVLSAADCDNFCINTNHDDSTCQQGTAITTAEQCAKAAKFFGLKTATIRRVPN